MWTNCRPRPLLSGVLLSCPAAANPPLLMRKTDTCAKLSLSLGLITFVIEVLTMECQLPQSRTVVSRLSQCRNGRRGSDGGNLNVLRVCGVHTAIRKQTRVEKAKIKFSAHERPVKWSMPALFMGEKQNRQRKTFEWRLIARQIMSQLCSFGIFSCDAGVS